MKRTEHVINKTMTSEGVHKMRITRISKADKTVVTGNKIVITGLLETGKLESVFLNADLVGNQTESFYDSAMFALANQLEEQLGSLPISNDDFETDDVELMNTLLTGKDFTCYCVHADATNGKKYANIHFEQNNAVKAMLATI